MNRTPKSKKELFFLLSARAERVAKSHPMPHAITPRRVFHSLYVGKPGVWTYPRRQQRGPQPGKPLRLLLQSVPISLFPQDVCRRVLGAPSGVGSTFFSVQHRTKRFYDLTLFLRRKSPSDISARLAFFVLESGARAIYSAGAWQ